MLCTLHPQATNYFLMIMLQRLGCTPVLKRSLQSMAFCLTNTKYNWRLSASTNSNKNSLWGVFPMQFAHFKAFLIFLPQQMEITSVVGWQENNISLMLYTSICTKKKKNAHSKINKFPIFWIFSFSTLAIISIERIKRKASRFTFCV